jgi:hypothetical protein
MNYELLKVVLQLVAIAIGLLSPFVGVVVALWVSRAVVTERLDAISRRVAGLESRSDLTERVSRAERDIEMIREKGDTLNEAIFNRLRRIELGQERIAAKLHVELPEE